MARGRVPLVRPPRFAQGGGAAPAFGMSGAPAVPVPGTRRGRLLAQQYADDERGRFTERIFVFPDFGPLDPGGSTVETATQQQTVQMVSNRTSFVRLVALRGTLKLTNTIPLTGLELANLTVRVSINGEEDLTTSGERSLPATFASLFSNESAPWFWFAAPPRLRVGDNVQATVTNTFAASTEIELTAHLEARLVDDRWWQSMYGYVDDDGDDDDGTDSQD